MVSRPSAGEIEFISDAFKRGMFGRDVPCVFISVFLCVPGILCGFNSSVVKSTLSLWAEPTQTDTHTQADWVAKERPDDGGPFNENETVVKTASHVNQPARV